MSYLSIECSNSALFPQVSSGRIGTVKRPENTAPTVHGPDPSTLKRSVRAVHKHTLKAFIEELPDYVEVLGKFEIYPLGTNRRWIHLPTYEANAEYVYIVREPSGHIVYVGRSMSVQRRMPGHAKKPWWSDANDVVILTVHGTTDKQALARTMHIENEAIQALGPSGNIAPGSLWHCGFGSDYAEMIGASNG